MTTPIINEREAEGVEGNVNPPSLPVWEASPSSLSWLPVLSLGNSREGCVAEGGGKAESVVQVESVCSGALPERWHK